MNLSFQKAVLLYQQNRNQEALGALDQAEREMPESASVAELRALVLIGLGRHDAAVACAKRAVELAPDSNSTHVILGRALLERGELGLAEASLREALRLDPSDPFDYGWLARVQLDQQRWEQALATAEQGLALDADNDLCLHQRAAALMLLGRKPEAAKAVEALLERSPNGSATHAALGYLLLHGGDVAAGKAAFLESLRLNPENEDAREGLVQALRAQHRLYGWLMRLMLVLGRTRTRGVVVLIVAGYVAFRLCDWLAGLGPEWVVPATLLRGLLWAAAVFVLVAEPLYDLVLRLSPEGRAALSPSAVRASNWNIACLLVGLGIGLFWAMGGGSIWGGYALGVLMLMPCFKETFQAPSAWVRRRLGWWTAVAAALLPVSLVLLVSVFVLRPPNARLLLRIAIYLPLATMIMGWTADNVREWLERRAPDPNTTSNGPDPSRTPTSA